MLSFHSLSLISQIAHVPINSIVVFFANTTIWTGDRHMRYLLRAMFSSALPNYIPSFRILVFLACFPRLIKNFFYI